jgi:hypothetical protein
MAAFTSVLAFLRTDDQFALLIQIAKFNPRRVSQEKYPSFQTGILIGGLDRI